MFIAVENMQGQMGRIRLKTIPNTTSESLLQATQRTIKQGSTICSDGWERIKEQSAKNIWVLGSVQ